MGAQLKCLNASARNVELNKELNVCTPAGRWSSWHDREIFLWLECWNEKIQALGRQAGGGGEGVLLSVSMTIWSKWSSLRGRWGAGWELWVRIKGRTGDIVVRAATGLVTRKTKGMRPSMNWYEWPHFNKSWFLCRTSTNPVPAEAQNNRA